MRSKFPLLPMLYLLVTVGLGSHLAGEDTAGERGEKVTIALIGDSTVTDRAGWGKAFADQFDDSVEVLNFAAGGRSAKSWFDEERLDEVLEERPDYLMIQFGHNGQPGKGPARETDPETTYREFLKIYIDAAKAIGCRPIVISSVTRRVFDESGKIRTEYQKNFARPLKPWAEAARAVAVAEGVPFLDLYGASVAYHDRTGPEMALSFSPKEGDFTHFNEKGAATIAGLVIGELKKTDVEFLDFLKK